MLPILALIGLAASALAVGTVAVLAVLYWDDVVAWFRGRSHLTDGDRDRVAFTLREHLATGRFRVVQGIFNTRSASVDDARIVEADRLDAELTRQHAGLPVAVYR